MEFKVIRIARIPAIAAPHLHPSARVAREKSHVSFRIRTLSEIRPVKVLVCLLGRYFQCTRHAACHELVRREARGAIHQMGIDVKEFQPVFCQNLLNAIAIK